MRSMTKLGPLLGGYLPVEGVGMIDSESNGLQRNVGSVVVQCIENV